ncbi:hypothetical protein EZS27_021021 [termite gut metagenome]|uniref:Uncharacterized protein n=1 Tax=termite gut metagenome TaxID=433724 RepID=A0A5J4R929_9ZZZZ
MGKRNVFIAQSIKDLRISPEQYLKLTNLNMAMTRELQEIAKTGIMIQSDSLDKNHCGS